MKLGLFLMPCHPPGRPLGDANRWNLEVIEHADRLGYDEAWIGEHFTVPWEPVPAPDLIVAQALQTTERIRLGPGAHIVPFHIPGVLAARLAFLDHASGGRLNVAFTQGTSTTDWRSFRPDVTEEREKGELMTEGMDLILKYWTEPGPWQFEGRHFRAEQVGEHPPESELLAHHVYPLQRPHPPIALAGIGASSYSMWLCGQRGWIPMSLDVAPRIVTQHWSRVEEGAAEAGREAHRSDWRVVKEVLVAETDAEARRLALEGCLGRYFSEFTLPLFRSWGVMDLVKDDPELPDSEVDIDYLCDRWLVGSVETVTSKLRELQEKVGGFGTLLVLGMDYSERPEVWFESMRLLAEEVVPNVGAVTA
ncbi:MAG TPA: LLM class flavin-dependent oxidoreductase [Thermoleophilaceae bacterium]|nr:LLM class flavin-dependent oxidoreductase [Thermoleophilaceae bacterium]